MGANDSANHEWLKPSEACGEARIGRRTFLAEVKAGRLKAARVNGRREFRVHRDWLREWLVRLAERT
jgi:excisionase family DNA binding protein